MKKFLMIAAVVLTAMVAQAQVKVAPKLVNGFKAVYSDVSKIDASGKPVNITSTTEYTVSDVTKDGAIITILVKDVTTDADANDITGKLLAIAQNMMKGVEMKLKTDANGTPTNIINFEEVKQRTTQAAEGLVDELLQAIPQLGSMMPKDKLIAQVTESVTEKALIDAYKTEDSPLTLNGKTITSGLTESFIDNQGLKMKASYFMLGKAIVCSKTLDMTKEELKEKIIKMVEKTAPEQAEMVKKNIDLVMSTMKFESTSKTTYELDADGWMKSIQTEKNQNMMGQKIQSTSTTKKL
jgi:hypothetical protein